jgi:hypothetical protein
VRIKELGNALDGEILALNRYEDRIGCSEGIQSQQVQRGWAVNYDESIPFDDRPNRLFQAIFAIVHGNELDSRANQILVRRNDIQAVDLGINRNPLNRLVENQRLIEGSAGGVLQEPKGAGGIGLRIAVDDQGTLLGCCQA